jgi:putative transposase
MQNVPVLERVAITRGAGGAVFQFDAAALGAARTARVLAIVDDFTRQCLALVADTSLPGLRVARELDVVIARCGRPAMIVSDNGTELTGVTIRR